MSPKVYAYEKCGTCREAMKYLEARSIPHTLVPIREQPPTRAELKRVLATYAGDVRRLFNTSGLEYRRLKLRDKLPKMTGDEAVALLAGNGNLVKRPFVLSGSGGRAGFDEEEWKDLLK